MVELLVSSSAVLMDAMMVDATVEQLVFWMVAWLVDWMAGRTEKWVDRSVDWMAWH